MRGEVPAQKREASPQVECRFRCFGQRRIQPPHAADLVRVIDNMRGVGVQNRRRVRNMHDRICELIHRKDADTNAATDIPLNCTAQLLPRAVDPDKKHGERGQQVARLGEVAECPGEVCVEPIMRVAHQDAVKQNRKRDRRKNSVAHEQQKRVERTAV
jgi:hypothetical protein